MRAVVNTALMPTGDFTRNRDADLRPAGTVCSLFPMRPSVRTDLHALDANALSEALMGDTVYANVLMLGAAWQAGSGAGGSMRR